MRLGTTIGRELKAAAVRFGSTAEELRLLDRLLSPEGGSDADVLALEGLAKLARVSWRTLWPAVYERALPHPSATPQLKDIGQ